MWKPIGELASRMKATPADINFRRSAQETKCVTSIKTSRVNLHETEGSCTAAVSVEGRSLLLSTKKVMALKSSNTTNGLLSNEHYRRTYGISKEHFVDGK